MHFRKLIKRKTVKRVACIMLAAGLVLTGQPAQLLFESGVIEAQAATNLTYTVGGSTYTYYVNDDNTVTIASWKGTYTDITIPDSIDGMSVTSIGSAFFGCSSITSIRIPEGVTSIGYRALEGCRSLTSVTIPESVTSIGTNAFSGCRSLTSITIPDSVTGISMAAFSGCSSLTSITIPEGVTGIMTDTFFGCSSLTSITIPESVTSIDSWAFSGCSSLIDINVSDNNETYTSVDGVLYNKGVTALVLWPDGKKGDYVIPDTVTSIGYSAFEGCSGLTSITIPESVTSIGSIAFSGCGSLTDINVSGNNQAYSSVEGVLYNKDVTELIRCPGGKTGDYVIPDTVTCIYSDAFSGCSSLTGITIPEGVTGIMHDTFFGCSSLTSITIPESVTSIGSSAFNRCSSLTAINVSDNNKTYTSVDGVLYNKDVTELVCCPEGKNGDYVIPDTVTSIGYSAFSGCSGLTSITIPESVTSIGSSAFYKCTSLTSIIIPEGVVSIGYSAFSGCSSLTDITIPEGVTSIDDYAFRNCSSLTSITIPKNVSSIGRYAIGYTYNDETDEWIPNENFVIYGYAGTAAETYANENGFKFVTYIELDKDGVKVKCPEGSVPEDVTLDAKKLTSEDAEYADINIKDNLADSSVDADTVVFEAYSIKLNSGSDEVKPAEEVKVMLASTLSGANVYKVNKDGTFTEMYASYLNGAYVFEMKDTGTYVITETQLKTKPEVTYGDANGDGNIDSKDAVLLKKYIAGYEGLTIDLEAADVNADGTVNSKDAVKLMKYIAGYDVVLGEM